MLIQLGLIVLLSIFNGFFVLSEFAVVASRKSHLKQLADHSKRARMALRQARNVDHFLSSIQVGITLVTLITGAVAGASLRDHIATLLQTLELPWLASHGAAVGSAAGFVIATFIQVVIGELVPKSIALSAPERLAAWVAPPMTVLERVLAPFVWLLDTSSRGIQRLLRIRHVSDNAVSEHEIRMLVAEGTEQGALDDDERNMVNRVLHLGDRNVGSVMTPRTRIQWLDADLPLADNLAVLRRADFSCYPIYRGDEADVLGVVEIKRLIDSVLSGQPRLEDNIVKPLFIPATLRALDLLDAFREAQVKMALVVDEYGDIEGLVTINDLLGTVVGQTDSDPSNPRTPWQREADGSLVIDGSLDVDDLRELLDLSALPHADEHDYHTLGGMLMTAFGHIPDVDETFVWHDLAFEVTQLEGARIGKVRVVRQEDTPATGD